MIRRTLAGPGAFIVAPVALLAALAVAWYATTGLVVGLVHAPALGVLATAALTAMYLGANPHRLAQLTNRKATR